MAQRTDAELCHMIQTLPQHSKRALGELVDRHYKLIYKLASKYWLPGIDRDDLTQEAILGFRYSCLSFDPKVATFNTHIGYGIMKFCRQLHTNSKYRSPNDPTPRPRMKRVPKSISQLPNAEETYLALQQPDQSRPVRLTPKRYNMLLKKLGHAVVCEDDQLALAIAYSVGPRHLRQQYKNHLWKLWLERKIVEITRRAKRVERKRIWEQQHPERAKRKKNKRPPETPGGLGGMRR